MLVFADESTWGGERREAGQLKGLVAEPTVLIRRKYLKAVEEPSAMHFVIASNSDWPIPVDWDDRRFFVLDVSDARQQQDTAYFGPADRGAGERRARRDAARPARAPGR